MRSVAIASLLIVAILASSGAGYLVGVGVSGSRTMSTTTTSTNTLTTTIFTTNQYIATPVPADFYINGQTATGVLCFNVSTHSQTWGVKADFPWKIQNGTAYPPPIRVEYTFAPFPLSGTIPSWLHLSMQPPYVTLMGGQNATASLQIGLDPTVENGQTANFAIHSNYIDPMSGSSVVNVIALGLVVNGSSTSLYDCSHSTA